MASDHILASLNPSQKAAVSCVADTLAILAGPGSGKTHTLTSRTAWLLHQGFQPWNVIVATFTVKAAREMKERIGKLIGDGAESKLILGTFHSIARRYLARYGHLINIPNDFGIADSADSLAIIKRITKAHRMTIDPKVARSRISARKSRCSNVQPKGPSRKPVEVQEFETCYTEYEAALERSNLLDYDDLLLKCALLLRSHPSCVSNIQAVLIDEFQDTNTVQLDLMRLFAAYKKRITIVGDPDQSIYSFRAAEIKNYNRMLKQYPETVTIPLEENYRSSGAILLTALTVIQQDASRANKSLTPTHTLGTPPVFRKLPRAEKEAHWILEEIKRCIGMTGDLLDLNDFAILLRSAALSRLIESELGKAGLPYRMVGGLRFYDRVEVKTVLDYLRVIDQPGNNDALARIINVPARGLGNATVIALLEEADQFKITLWSLILGAVQGNRTPKMKLRKQAEKGLSSLVNIILTARKRLDTRSSNDSAIIECIKLVLEKTNYEEWLKEHHNDAHKARWDNVQELITQASDYQTKASTGSEDDSLPYVNGVEQMDASDTLARFLANVALASHVEMDEALQPPVVQITISTIHAAKGLEWPIVFIPATYQGSIPHSRAEDVNEERRLLYVAMTRAQALLYMSCPLKSSQGEEATISPFLSVKNLATLLESKGPSFTSSTIQQMSLILGRTIPSEMSIRNSSADLPSREDDLFKDEREEDTKLMEERWARTEAFHTSTGQQPVKRRRYDCDGMTGMSDTKCITTMDRAYGFTSATVALQTTFAQALGQTPFPMQSITDSASRQSIKKQRLVGQGTLLGFLGKAEVPIDSQPALSLGKPSKSRRQTSPTTTKALRISPLLANHRLGLPPRPRDDGHTIGNKPCVSTDEASYRNHYSFLDSSPIQQGSSGNDVLDAKQVSSKFDKFSVRPAAVIHETSMDMMLHSTQQRRGKTLGMHNVNSGGGKKPNGAFVPPLIKR